MATPRIGQSVNFSMEQWKKVLRVLAGLNTTFSKYVKSHFAEDYEKITKEE